MSSRTIFRTARIVLTILSCAALIAGCGTQSGDTQDLKSFAADYAQTMKVFVDTKGVDTGPVERFYAEDAVFEDVPMKERVEGRDKIMAMFRETSFTLPTTDTVESTVAGQGWFAVQDRVVTEHFDGTEITFFTVCEVKDGLITHQWETYASDAPWLEQ
jgi:predicted small secreted protein